MKEIYLDDAAATKVSRAVVNAIIPYFGIEYGNPSSSHQMGERARKVVEDSRKILSEEINAKPWEIIFTSGTTESNNLALQGLARASKKRKIIISALEHASIVETCKYLGKKGFKIVVIPVDKEGLVDIKKLEKEIDNETMLVSIMHVNNLIGTIQDIERIGKICKSKGVLFHTDASQSYGKLKIDVKKMNIDLLSASSHKIGGPKDAGILYIREGVKIEPLIFGGGQERGLRGGTENVPIIVGFAEALKISKKTDWTKIAKLRDFFAHELQSEGKINGSMKSRIYNNIHFSFDNKADSIIAFLSKKGIYVSRGSACDSKKEKEDYVLKSIGLNEKQIAGAVRITLGSDLSYPDAKRATKEIKKTLRTLKEIYRKI